MLQQTRVETAVPYFERFLTRFPTPEALATAPTEEVLAAWSGLGYYRRARLLQEAAREVVAGGSGIPTAASELARLPGIGPYTAAAIASIAFDEPVPVLDGNVERVLARFLAEPEPVALAATRRRLLALAAELLDRTRPGDSNQALMELGATLCQPRAPRCGGCPLAPGCRSRAAGTMSNFPVRLARAPARRICQVAALAERQGAILLFRRDESEPQLAGLWELPLVEARRRDVASRRLGARFGGSWRLVERLAAVRHAITDRSFAITAYRAEYSPRGGEAADVAEGVEAGWFAPESAEKLALSGAARKLLARLAGGVDRRSAARRTAPAPVCSSAP